MNKDSDHVNFCQVLKHSLSVEKTTPAFCEICKKFTPTNQYARVTELPQILSVNCGLTNEKEMTFLRKQMGKPFGSGSPANGETAGVQPTNSGTTLNNTSTPMKPCRYALNCSRVDCHFSHPDRKSPTTSTASSASAKSISLPVTPSVNARSSTWFPLQFTMEIEEESNELKIELKSASDEMNGAASDSGTENTSTEEDANNLKSLPLSESDGAKKERTISENTIASSISTSSASSAFGASTTTRKLYKLSAVVCQVNNSSQKNLVSLIHVGKRYHESKLGERDPKTGQWYIFNDFR